jgi:hypothetical protein
VSGVHRAFALEVAIDMFRVSPEPSRAMNLSNVVNLLGDEHAANKIWAEISGAAPYDAAVEHARQGKDATGRFASGDVKAMLAAGDAMTVPRPDVVIAVAEHVLKGLHASAARSG